MRAHNIPMMVGIVGLRAPWSLAVGTPQENRDRQQLDIAVIRCSVTWESDFRKIEISARYGFIPKTRTEANDHKLSGGQHPPRGRGFAAQWSATCF